MNASAARPCRHDRSDRPIPIEHQPSAGLDRRGVEGARPDVSHILADREDQLDQPVREARIRDRLHSFHDGRHPGLVVGAENA